MEEKLIRCEDVMWSIVDGEAVLLKTTSGKYFGMNKTATAFWTIIDTPKTTEEIIQTMANRFSVARERIASDIEKLIPTLMSKQLIGKF